MARSAVTRLEAKRVVVERAWAGTFLSALDMPGFSLSVMHVDDAMLNLMDAPTDAGAWPRGGVVNRNRVLPSVGVKTSVTAQSSVTVAGERLRSAAERVAGALIAAEPKLTQLDSVTGDGDLGTSMVRGAEAILALPRQSFADISGGLMEMANAMRKAIGGSSGPFYATGLMRASRHLAGIEKPTAQQMAEAFVAAVLAVSELGGAKPGDRTMIDALHPAAATFRDKLAAGASADDAWRSALAAGTAGAEATTSMKPRLGRASYLGERAMGHPDAGAVAVSIWLEAIGND